MFKKNISILLLSAGAAMALVACGSTSSPSSEASSAPSDKITVSFMDGSAVLKTEEIEKGTKVASYTPVKDGTSFIDWYLTPSFSRYFDFDASLNADTQIYGAFSTYAEDTRNYFIAGSGTSKTLTESNWGKVATDNLKFAKASDANVNKYTYTANLFSGDMFQVTELSGDPLAWGWQFGYGYIKNVTEVADFTKSSGGLADSTRKNNIQLTKDGNYTITLVTYPDHDNDSEDNAAAKINNCDRLTIVRNGDSTEEKATGTTDFYIKGNKITNWQNVYDPQAKMSYDKATNLYSLTTFLDQGDEFMFFSRFTDSATNVTTDGNEFIKGENLAADEDTTTALKANANGNILANIKGQYVFVYDATTKKLSAKADASKYIAEGKYYLNSNLLADDWSISTCFNEGYRLNETAEGSFVYKASGIVMAEGKEFAIAEFTADATEPGKDWANSLGSFNFQNLAASGEANANDQFEAANLSGEYPNYNLKVKTAGTYDVTFDAYSSLITIIAHAS
ncbi:MAG: hypothetical protein LKG11_01420 [Bacilli bacterium]|jgi:hypothetical protein|nr:hypothetical protein [Bacilli bacterium]